MPMRRKRAPSALRAWDNAGNVASRGSQVWDEFWNRVTVPAAPLYAVAFDAADPLNTPRDLKPGASDALHQAFGAAVQKVQASGFSLDGFPHGNSYMQVVSFPAGGVEAHSFLTFSLSDDPGSKHYGDYTKAYGAKQWLRVPFSEAEITSSKDYTTVTVRE